MSKTAPQNNKRIARTLANAFGGTPKFRRYWDDQEQCSVDILQSVNPTDNSITDYGTIGLSDYPLYKDSNEFPVRLELVGTTVNGDNDIMANLLTTAAFTVIKDQWFCHPNAVLMDTVELYDKSLAVKHLYFTSPGLWDDNLDTQQLDTKKVTWLHAIPITEGERQYILTNGADALETIFEERQTDIADLKRSSVA